MNVPEAPSNVGVVIVSHAPHVARGAAAAYLRPPGRETEGHGQDLIGI